MFLENILAVAVALAAFSFFFLSLAWAWANRAALFPWWFKPVVIPQRLTPSDLAGLVLVAGWLILMVYSVYRRHQLEE